MTNSTSNIARYPPGWIKHIWAALCEQLPYQRAPYNDMIRLVRRAAELHLDATKPRAKQTDLDWSYFLHDDDVELYFPFLARFRGRWAQEVIADKYLELANSGSRLSPLRQAKLRHFLYPEEDSIISDTVQKRTDYTSSSTVRPAASTAPAKRRIMHYVEIVKPTRKTPKRRWMACVEVVKRPLLHGGERAAPQPKNKRTVKAGKATHRC